MCFSAVNWYCFKVFRPGLETVSEQLQQAHAQQIAFSITPKSLEKAKGKENSRKRSKRTQLV